MNHAAPRHRCLACDGPVLSETYPEGVIHRCPHCKLQWADRTASAIIGDVDVTGVHSRYMDPASIAPSTYEPFRSFFVRIGRLFGDRPLNILDIGCGNGVFLAEAARRGHQVHGIELDERHRAVIPAAILPHVVFAYAEQALPRIEGAFDVVTFWDSFEHIDAPYALLEHVRPRLARDGVVFVRVNNTHDVFNLITAAAMAVAPRTLGRRLLKACFNLPQHAWNFSHQGMATLLDRHGWQLRFRRATETPATRLVSKRVGRLALQCAYTINRMIGGGKIGEYYFAPKPARAVENT